MGAQKKSRDSAVSRAALMGPATFAAAPRGTAILMASRTATLIPLPGLFLGGRFPKRQFAKGSFIKQPDDRSDNIYLIEAGKVATFFLGPQGHDVPFPELEAGISSGISRRSAMTSRQPISRPSRTPRSSS